MTEPHTDSAQPPRHSGRLMLAPMEGVVDAIMRDMLTRIGGYDRCVTEFVRISQTVLPRRVFYRLCPELHDSAGHTSAGVPVFVQLLGSDPELMARNAEVATALGAPGIDLNFGCPAKTVNKSEGGAALLRRPELIAEICSTVRHAVPANIPVTAKIRLGFDDTDSFEKIAALAISSGISELVVHARTRRQGYRPPALWHLLAETVAQSPIPIIANGEMWSPSDVARCAEVSGCEDVMIARGALCRPDLARAVRAHRAGEDSLPLMTWSDIQPLLPEFMHRNAKLYEAKYAVNPLKQWLVYLKHHFPQAAALFAAVKRIRDFDEMDAALRIQGSNPKLPDVA